MQANLDIEATKKRITEQKENIQKIDEVKGIIESSDDARAKDLLSELRAKIHNEFIYFRDSVDSVETSAYANDSISAADIGKLNSFDDWMYSVVLMLESTISQLQAAGIAVPVGLLNAYNYLHRRMREAEANTKAARLYNNNEYDGNSMVSNEDEFEYSPLGLGSAFKGRAHEVQNYSVEKRRKKRETLTIRLDDRASETLQSAGAYLQIPEKTKASTKFRDMYGRGPKS